MLFKIEESLPEEVTSLLADAGHGAVSVRSQGLGGSGDPRIAKVCQSENRALIPLDLDFADIRVYPPSDYSGLVVLRQKPQDRDSVLTAVRGIIPLLDQEQLTGRLWIVSPQSVRIHD